ncbi:phage tail tape measure protein [Terrisporobacter petrolearius]|uniref:phage tail tape measure protein n=1 Tax=Terrisporobacter petrolearius TaxID=1460447 RepID=UPI003AFFEF26
MATTVVSTKLNLDIGNFKSKMQDAKKSIEDLQKSFKSAGGKSWDPFKSTDLGKKIDDIKTKAGNLGETFKALPGPVKAGAVIIAVTASLKKLYDLGKQRFFEGLLDIKDTISPVLNGITTAINTVKQAFTEITGFNFNFTSIITTGVNFEAQMKKVATIAGSIGIELNQLISKARELGAATTFSATEVGEAMQYMAMAGWSTSEMLEGVQSTLNLAKIGSTDLGTASDILTDDLTALGMSANQAGDFADKLAATITRSNTDVVLFGESMKQTGAVAGALGVSMTDLSTAIGLQANAGIKGSKAGMSLKNLFTNMANPTDKMTAALEKLGMTADQSGSYLKTTADGCTDLEATVKSLKEGTDGMTRSQKASLIATVAGKNALPGIMSLINASTEEYNSLSEAVDNSTSTVAMFNENMSVLGLSGKGATDAIQNMKQIFSDTELSATALGLSSKDLGFSISLLGDDSKVTKDNVEDLLDVIDSMNNASGKTDTAWRNLGNAENLDLNKYIDYNSTLGEIDNSIVGLSGSQKDHVKSLIKENMTVDEANKVLKQYGLSAKQVSLSTMTTSEKMDYLRNSLNGMSDEQMKSELSNLGLADSFEEVNEIVDMSDDKYSKYKKNLETIQGLSDRMAKSIDETTKSAFFALSSAMEDTLLGAFDRLKPALLSGSEALTDFFSTWRGQDGNYSFSGFEQGLNDLESKVEQASNNIPSLMDNMFNGINRFINGGALDSFLNMGTDIVQNIAKGIINNKENITESISGLIEKICNWINTNGPAIEEAGKVIIKGLRDGIAKNATGINSAVETVFEVINTFLAGKQDMLQTTGSIVGASFIKGMITGVAIEGVNTIGNSIYAIVSTIGQFTADFAGVAINLATSFVDSFMGFIFDCGLWDSLKQGFMDFDKWIGEFKLGQGEGITTKAQDAGFNYGKAEGDGRNKGLQDSKTQTDATASQIGQGISDNILNKLETMDASQLKDLEDELRRLQSTTGEVASGIGTNFGKIRESVRTNLMGVTNIGRNQFVNLTNVVRNQCVNQANIVRNQFTSISNIVRNQSQNARNSATTSFISMSKVISTQCTNARTAVVSKMMSINAVVNTQAWKARDNATRAFMSLAAVVRTQMSNALTSVRNAMSQIASATNRTLTTKVNVSKTITTTNVAKSIQAKPQTFNFSAVRSIQPRSFSLAATRSLGGINSLATASYGSPVALASTNSGVSGSTTYGGTKGTTKTNSKPTYFEIPLVVDGREMAKASAKYMDGELKIISNRNNRKKGV